jgi:hypothetical protein
MNMRVSLVLGCAAAQTSVLDLWYREVRERGWQTLMQPSVVVWADVVVVVRGEGEGGNAGVLPGHRFVVG